MDIGMYGGLARIIGAIYFVDFYACFLVCEGGKLV